MCTRPFYYANAVILSVASLIGKYHLPYIKILEQLVLQPEASFTPTEKKSCQIMATLNKHEDIKRESIKNFLNILIIFTIVRQTLFFYSNDLFPLHIYKRFLS